MTAPSVPRVATSLDELRVGQVVAWETYHGRISGGEIGYFQSCSGLPVTNDGNIPWTGATIVILSDPPPEPGPVPRELFDQLASLLDEYSAVKNTAVDSLTIARAARALVDAVRGAE